jgi:CHAT domain-containing protein
LVHYSGHTYFDRERSAWLLKDGNITTDLLTNALQMAPPAPVFISSCQSPTASDHQEIGYENRTFDLPSAFLQAGVEVYVGAAWNVARQLATQFVEEFYSPHAKPGDLFPAMRKGA